MSDLRDLTGVLREARSLLESPLESDHELAAEKIDYAIGLVHRLRIRETSQADRRIMDAEARRRRDYPLLTPVLPPGVTWDERQDCGE